jgi:hypothetical protein
MKVLGIVLNNNVLAIILGLGVIFLCLTISYVFQKNLFGKYRRKVSNVVNKNGSKDTSDQS